jgi:hypothetical protein
MDGVDVDAIRKIQSSDRHQVKQILKGESRQLEVTKSLLNLVHNIVRVGSVPVSAHQRAFLDKNADLVLRLLNKKTSLKAKKDILESHPSLVLNIAASWHTVDGS